MASVLSCLLILISIHYNWAQELTLEMINSQPIDNDRYVGIDGSPYLFNGWKKARILNEELQFINNAKVNYNGETQEFEVSDGIRYIQLDERAHERVEVWDEQIEAYLIFTNAYSYGLDVPFAQMHYGGSKVVWLSTFVVKIDERTLETPGKTEHIKKFVPIRTNYFIIDNSAIEFKMKKKKILAALQKFPDTQKIVSENKLSIDQEDDLLFLLKSLEGSSGE